MPEMDTSAPTTLALFPLGSVLFPGGLLSLKVFEARYLDLVSTCLREKRHFGVVLVGKGKEPFAMLGTAAMLMNVEASSVNILQVRCMGTQRFEIKDYAQTQNGLWQAQVQMQPRDEAVLPSSDLVSTARALANAIASLKLKGSLPFAQPFHFDNAGWVANRWSEILPISNLAKQQLMALPDPLMRLNLVAQYLRGKGLIG
jgi:uncharacterized protein